MACSASSTMTMGTHGPEGFFLGHPQRHIPQDHGRHIEKPAPEPLIGRAIASRQYFSTGLVGLGDVQFHPRPHLLGGEGAYVRLGVGEARPHRKRGGLFRETLDELGCHRPLDEEPVDGVA